MMTGILGDKIMRGWDNWILWVKFCLHIHSCVGVKSCVSIYNTCNTSCTSVWSVVKVYNLVLLTTFPLHCVELYIKARFSYCLYNNYCYLQFIYQIYNFVQVVTMMYCTMHFKMLCLFIYYFTFVTLTIVNLWVIFCKKNTVCLNFAALCHNATTHKLWPVFVINQNTFQGYNEQAGGMFFNRF